MVHFLKGAKRFSAENSGLYKTVTKKKNRREYNKKGKTTNRTTLPETGYTDMIFNMKTRYFLKIYLLKKGASYILCDENISHDGYIQQHKNMFPI